MKFLIFRFCSKWNQFLVISNMGPKWATNLKPPCCRKTDFGPPMLRNSKVKIFFRFEVFFFSKILNFCLIQTLNAIPNLALV